MTSFLSYARYRNAQGWGIYLTPSVLKPRTNNRRQESFADQQQIIYLDCDQPTCIERIRMRYPYPTLVVRTSKGRHQVYWRLQHPVTVHQQEQLMSEGKHQKESIKPQRGVAKTAAFRATPAGFLTAANSFDPRLRHDSLELVLTPPWAGIGTPPSGFIVFAHRKFSHANIVEWRFLKLRYFTY